MVQVLTAEEQKKRQQEIEDEQETRKKSIRSYSADNKAEIAANEQRKAEVLKGVKVIGMTEIPIEIHSKNHTTKDFAIEIPAKLVHEYVPQEKALAELLIDYKSLDYSIDKLHENIQGFKKFLEPKMQACESAEKSIKDAQIDIVKIDQIITEKQSKIKEIDASAIKSFFSYFTGEKGRLQTELDSAQVLKKETEKKLISGHENFNKHSNDLKDSLKQNQKSIKGIEGDIKVIQSNAKELTKKIELTSHKPSNELFPFVLPLFSKLNKAVEQMDLNVLKASKTFETLTKYDPQKLREEHGFNILKSKAVNKFNGQQKQLAKQEKTRGEAQRE